MAISSHLSVIVSFGLVFALANCSRSNDENSDEVADGDEPAYQASAQPRLQWKRYAALEADLARALELEPESLCKEFGQVPCIRGVHLVPLGGHDPFGTGLFEPSLEPLATTPSAVDRVLLNACKERVSQDRSAGRKKAVVFDAFDLKGDAPEPEAESTRKTIVSLYRRFLGRDPDAHEVPIVAALTRDEDDEPIEARDFAVLSCFAVGTTTEFLFF